MEPSKIGTFKELTWSEIQEWAGDSIVSRGQSYQRNHRVKELAITPSGRIIAWVYGTERYATLVDSEGGALKSACTCPFGATCKHAVAVTLEYLDHLKRKVDVPTVGAMDQRLVLLQGPSTEETWHEGDNDNEDGAPVNLGRREKVVLKALHSYLEQQPREQLIALLEEMAGRHPVVRQSLEDRRDLSAGTVARLINSVRKEIDELSAEPGWSHPWSNEGHVPDYSRVRERLEGLLAQGHADEVVSLGEKLMEAGRRQVEMSDDEGETAQEISTCLEIVFRALPQSSLTPADQLLWAVEADLNDEYDLCYGAQEFWQQEFAPATWNTAAEKLSQRLNQQKSTKGEDSFSKNYRRDRLSDWLIVALEKAGRQSEIIPLCEREAKETASYIRLVNRLQAASRPEKAEHWIYEGIKATQRQSPGIASQLRIILRQIREK